MSNFGLTETKAAIELIKLARKQGWLDNLFSALRKKHRVLVLGTTGAGKTNLLASLTEAVPQAIDEINRTEFVKERALKIAKQPFIFIDTPGQAQHRAPH